MALADKVVFLTGASRGIGEAGARHFARAGCAVVLAARSRPRLEALAAEIAGEGGKALAVACDVTDQPSVEKAFGEARRAFGGVDILVNNAGAGGYGPFASVAVEIWQRALGVNLTGAFLCTRQAIPDMRARGGGCIVNMTTGLSHLTLPNSGPYAVAKAGVNHFSRLLDVELRPDNIRVVVFSPGIVQTEMAGEWLAFGTSDGLPIYPPDAVAPMLLELCRTERPVEGKIVNADDIRAWPEFPSGT
jgi:NAD(P)-dependent dehydrogenase (short-subunit alcohol dehydrogenase family)